LDLDFELLNVPGSVSAMTESSMRTEMSPMHTKRSLNPFVALMQKKSKEMTPI
jgi:hypothetical protein